MILGNNGHHRLTGSARTAVTLAAILLAGLGGFFVEWVSLFHAADAAARSALETGTGLLALAGIALLAIEFRRTRRRRDLFLIVTLVASGLTTLVFDTLPAYQVQTDVHADGVLVALTLVRSGALLAAALTSPARRLEDHGPRARLPLVLAVLATLVMGELLQLVVAPVHSTGTRGGFEPLVTIATLFALGMALLAALDFARRAARAHDESGLLAAAGLLLAGSQLSRLAVPFPPHDWLIPADALRLGFFALMLWISLRMYRRSEVELAHTAVVEERLRIARDLHDSLAQDLALIAAYADRLAQTHGREHPVAIAAARALEGARGRIVDLEASDAESVEEALREVGAELSTTLGINVIVDAAEANCEQELDQVQRGELVRIAREGIANAVRHGGAQTVTVRLGSRRSGALLTLHDDGCGLARARPGSSGTGLGLRTMRKRARRLGARLLVADGADGGAEIEVIALGASEGEPGLTSPSPGD